MKGVEPPRRRRQILSLVRLPIPPHPHFTLYIVGGGWWIRTTESNANRFTVCPLWPLGKSSTLELVIGIEPTTCWLQVSCSTVEPHQHIGGNNRTRTCDPLINSQLLYQLSHIPICINKYKQVYKRSSVFDNHLSRLIVTNKLKRPTKRRMRATSF